MSVPTIAGFAASILLCIAGAAQAANIQDDDLRVVGSRTPALAWRAAVANDISANLSAPRPSVGQPLEGVVEVTFHADAQGRIDQISVVTPSGSPSLDRAAVTAVSRMKTLRTAPAGIDTTRPVEAWVCFANTDAVAERLEATLRHSTPGLALNGHSIPLLVSARG